MSVKRLWLFALALIASAGAYYAIYRPDPAQPALWRVDGPGGQSAFLFGTIHSLPRPVAWRTDKVAKALAQSDCLLVEIAGLDNGAMIQQAFEAVAHTPGLPPLDQRVSPQERPRLLAALARLGKAPGDFTHVETWAAAIMLAREDDGAGDPAYGVDRALIKESGLPAADLEGATQQFATFDHLPEAAQRRLLVETLITPSPNAPDLAQAWRKGDMATIATQTHTGILADPTLHEALYVARNRRWAGLVAQAMAQHRHPFVAVGAAHMAGVEGLPAMLAARGYRVQRLQ